MPLKTGRSIATQRGNVAEILHSYKRKGTIGTSKPGNMGAAQRQAVAISKRKAGVPPKAGRKRRGMRGARRRRRQRARPATGFTPAGTGATPY